MSKILTMKKHLNSDTIKYIAVFAMLLDHIAWAFLPFSAPLSQVFHTFGRITAPIMCFFIAEGYCYTRSVKKYALRLFVFALISQVPWWLMHGEMFTLSFSMMFTLLLSLLAVHAYARVADKTEKAIYITLLCLCSLLCDWYVFAPLWCVGFYIYRNDNKKKYLWFSAVSLSYFLYNFYGTYSASADLLHALLSSLFTFGTFLCIPLLTQYNGQRGKFKQSKWIFYTFYPLHMLVIGIIKMIISK